MKAAKMAVRRNTELVWGIGVEGKVAKLGSERYRTHHTLQYPAADGLQSRIDAYMARFAALEQSRSKRLAQLRQVPDEQGFVTVTRGGRMGPARVEEAKRKAEEQKEKNKGKEDFYRFQVREKKEAEATHLLKAFNEDKRKVEDMRRRRDSRKVRDIPVNHSKSFMTNSDCQPIP
jgi:ribosomal RNA-processing protein 7